MSFVHIIDWLCLGDGTLCCIVDFQYIIFTHYDSQCAVGSVVFDLVFVRFIMTIALVLLFGECFEGSGCIQLIL